MQCKPVKLFALVLMLLLIACSSENEKQIKGKWSLSGPMIVGPPTSFWFKWGGRVVAPWEANRKYMESSGKYKFTDDTHFMIKIDKGYYTDNIFHFEILELDKEHMVLQTNFQEIRLKRVEEE